MDNLYTVVVTVSLHSQQGSSTTRGLAVAGAFRDLEPIVAKLPIPSMVLDMSFAVDELDAEKRIASAAESEPATAEDGAA